MHTNIGLEQGRRNAFDDQYCSVFHTIWSHPLNDQRPAVHAWLDSTIRPHQQILDIGSGDPYYIRTLRPSSYSAVEPNDLLRQRTKAAAGSVGLEPTIYTSVHEMLASSTVETIDIVMMIHVLFYLSSDELSALLASVRKYRKRLLLVHPDPAHSVSVAFEREQGLSRSERLLRLKSQQLGAPRSRIRTLGHFVLPIGIPSDMLAFLLSHHLMNQQLESDLLQVAKHFVDKHIDKWRTGSNLKLPQSQIMEIYG